MKVEIKKVNLSEIKPNPDNPRQINKKQMERLEKSLKEFPDMMELREIVCDEDLMILGGNMRYLALKNSGEKEAIVKIASGLTPEQKREFIIKDNAAFGEWDMDALANVWDDLPLEDWGVNLPEDWTDESIGDLDIGTLNQSKLNPQNAFITALGHFVSYADRDIIDFENARRKSELAQEFDKEIKMKISNRLVEIFLEEVEKWQNSQ